MKKRFISIFLILIMSISIFTGCTSKQVDNRDYDEFIEIVDMADRTVQVPTKVGKIFSIEPVGTILIYTLNPDKMVGWNYDLRDGEKGYIDEKYHGLPNLGGAGKQPINVEEILKIEPDVLITVRNIDDTLISEIEELEEKLGKSIVLIDGDINKLDEAYNLLGKIMNEEEKAGELGKYCRDTLDNIKENLHRIEENKKVNIYYAEGPEGLETEPAGSWHGEVIDMVGGNNVAKVVEKGEKGKSIVSIEQVLKWNPDIIISWDDERGGYYSGILKDPLWKDIKAVKEGKVYKIPNKPFNWFDRPPSANRILGLKWLGNLLYPEVYNYNMREEAKEFYHKFYHYQLTEEELDQLLK